MASGETPLGCRPYRRGGIFGRVPQPIPGAQRRLQLPPINTPQRLVDVLVPLESIVSHMQQ